MKPTVGRIVHVVRDGKCLATIVTGVEEEKMEDGTYVILGAVFLTDVVHYTQKIEPWTCRYSENKEPGTWHWPEREE